MECAIRREKNPLFPAHAQQANSLLRLWVRRYRTRKQLHELMLSNSALMHHDLGLSTAAALEEIKKPFWH